MLGWTAHVTRNVARSKWTSPYSSAAVLRILKVIDTGLGRALPPAPTFLPHVPYLEAILAVYGEEVVAEWEERVDVPLVPQERAFLRRPHEQLDDVLVSRKNARAIMVESHALDEIGLSVACREITR